MNTEHSIINSVLENHQKFDDKIEKDKEKFSLTHAFNKIDGFSKKYIKKIMIGGTIVLSMGIGSFGATAYHYAKEIEKTSEQAEKLLFGPTSEIQDFLSQKKFHNLQSENNIYIPFDNNFYNTLKQHYDSDKEIVIQSPFVPEQKIYFYTHDSFKSNEQFNFYENFEKQDAIKMSKNRAFAYNSKRKGHNIIHNEYSKHYIVVDKNVPANFTDYEDLKDIFVIFHEAAHTHFIQELNFLNPNFETHRKQINESNSDVTAIISTVKYFDLDYPTFKEVFSGLLSMRIEDAKENKENGHNTSEVLEYLLDIDEKEYNSLKNINYPDIPYFANDLVLNLGLSDYRNFDKEELLSKLQTYDSSSLNDESFNHLMLDIRHFLKNNSFDNNEQLNLEISQHIKSFRALLSEKGFIDFIKSDGAPESLKNSKDIKSMAEEFKKEHLKFTSSLGSFLSKIANNIHMDTEFKNELDIPELTQLATKDDNTDLRNLKTKYKIK